MSARVYETEGHRFESCRARSTLFSCCLSGIAVHRILCKRKAGLGRSPLESRGESIVSMVSESGYGEESEAAQARPGRVICVLGMHRSGTSCLTGSLQQQGLFLGEHNTEAPWNRKGNRENGRILNLHEDILEKSGGSWVMPPPAVEWQLEHFETARKLLAEYQGYPVWGFKDPRNLLTISGWRRLLPDLELVGIFRHPLKVAQSLKKRSNDWLDVDEGLALWKIYNERLVELRRENSFPLVCFDEEAGALQEKLRQAGKMLGLKPYPPGEPFFTDDLRHAPAEGGPLPPDLKMLYEELRTLALDRPSCS
jgi:hypothetical protein